MLYRKDIGGVHVSGNNTVGVRMSIGKSDNLPIYMKELTKTVLLILIIIAICCLPFLILSIWILITLKMSNTVGVVARGEFVTGDSALKR